MVYARERKLHAGFVTGRLFFNSDPAARGTVFYIAVINVDWGNRLLRVYHVNWSIVLFS